MDDAVAAVDEPSLVELDESFPDRAGQLRRKGVSRAVPVRRNADGAQLPQDFASSLLDECDRALNEGRAAEIKLRFAFGGELFLYDVLGRNAGVVGARNPERFVTNHATPAKDHVLDGVVEPMPHVQHGCHIRRGHDDHERIAVSTVVAAALFVGGKNPGVDPALVNGALGLAGVVLGRQLVKLLYCAHLRRKLTGAIFAGKTARLAREVLRWCRYALDPGRVPLPGARSSSAT